MHIEGLPAPAILYHVQDGDRLVHVTAYDQGKTVCTCGDADCNHAEPVKAYFEELKATGDALRRSGRCRS